VPRLSLFLLQVLLQTEFAFVYDDSDSDSDEYNSPSSYRQPSGNGQSLSRRYCNHSECFFSCADRTASSSQGALATSCKYFKQSK